MWIARITLRSWIPQDSINAKTNAGVPPTALAKDTPIIIPYVSSDADEDAPIRMPAAFEGIELLQKDNVTNKTIKVKMPDQPFKLTMSSLIISTNAFGDFSKCTIISETIKDSYLVEFVSKSQELWQKFVNQPQAARCLIFLLAQVSCVRELRSSTKQLSKPIRTY